MRKSTRNLLLSLVLSPFVCIGCTSSIGTVFDHRSTTPRSQPSLVCEGLGAIATLHCS